MPASDRVAHWPAQDSSHPSQQQAGVEALHIQIGGRVQGLGVRPAIARLAQQLGVAGHVSNCSQGVAICAEGSRDLLFAFRQQLTDCLPPEARISFIAVEAVRPTGLARFRIEATTREGALAVRAPPDLAVCSACLAESSDRRNRRFQYPFTSCTRCGPRYSLIQAMPYDRDATSMHSFRQCAQCMGEYGRIIDRRFHSQTNCCPACGPGVWLATSSQPVVARSAGAMEQALAALQDGKIVAVRGLGGYQLLVDATSGPAVARLRGRKGRDAKPLAVMVSDLAMAQRLARLSLAEQTTLSDPANPIVVVQGLCDSPVAKDVNGGLDTLGLMLPTTVLHAAIVRGMGQPLVVTSGNREGEPLWYQPATAEQSVSEIPDVWLHHNRDIMHPIDDSVVRVVAGQPMTIRLARGLAPFPLEMESDRAILALGGHQKSAIALSTGTQAVLGPHLGDLDSEAMRIRYVEHIEKLCQLYQTVPSLVVHDGHPDYFSTRWATANNIPTMAVQHHHAHVVAGMIEHRWLDRQVLGVAWDGTGYGPDGTIWGGEFLLANSQEYLRVGCLRPFFLPGYEAALREPWRAAVSLALQAGGHELVGRLRFSEVSGQSVNRISKLVQRSSHGVWSTSAGRLFDGIAALILGVSESRYEAEAAMLVEAIADRSAAGDYPLPLLLGEPAMLDWRPLVIAVLQDRQAGLAPGVMAMKFHRSLARGIAALVVLYPGLPVLLTGGCFQNQLLTELAAESLEGSSRLLGLPGMIPVGDGGLAAGQLAVAMARSRGGQTRCA